MLIAGSAVLLLSPAHAEFTEYDTQTYDWAKLGVPKFIKTNYIELGKVIKISKFRSSVGHDYSDSTQFSKDAYPIPFRGVEGCRSMKHYLVQPDTSVNIFAPVSGVISRIFEEELGTQLHITSDVQPAFTIIIFHIKSDHTYAVGEHLDEGQHLGTHFTSATFSDIAVAVHTPTGYHLVSYFETLTDEAFAPFKERGINSPADLIYTREERDAKYGVCGNPVYSSVPEGQDFVNLTGGAVAQTINFPTVKPDFLQYPGAPNGTIEVTSTSGLPVTITSLVPKVCPVSGKTISWRRAGVCTVELSQAGDANTFAAFSQRFTFTVLPRSGLTTGRPNLGGVRPPSASGSQSYLRFVNSGPSPGAVTVTLFDGSSGKAAFTWTSPTIPPGAAPQFDIGTLENAAPAGFARPKLYGLRVEPATTMTGSLQHVLFNPATRVITNASSCDNGVNGNPGYLPGVHTSLLADMYPSTIVYLGDRPGSYPYFEAHDAGTGAAIPNGNLVGTAANNYSIAQFSEYVLPVADYEKARNFKPAPGNYHYVVVLRGGEFFFGHFQHLVHNKAANAVTDMTTVCDLSGITSYTVPFPTQVGSVFSGTQVTGGSILRFYNGGTTAYPVTLTLRDVVSGASLGTWTSPNIAPGAAPQFGIDEIEAAIGLTKHDTYVVGVDTNIDGVFQHLAWRAPDGVMANLSTCAGGATTGDGTVIGVHGSAVADYPSSVIVNNTGDAGAAATLAVYDARDGTRLGAYASAAIAGHSQLQLDAAAIEAGAKIAAGAPRYVIKLEGAFPGYLQHFVTNTAAGAISDMTPACLM